MSDLSTEELREFESSVAKALAGDWPKATAAGGSRAQEEMVELWRVAAGAGVTALGVERALAAALTATTVTGRLALPLPLGDAFVAQVLLTQRPDLQERIGTGELCPAVLLPGCPETRFVEAPAALTHVLHLEESGAVRLRPVRGFTEVHATARPRWGLLDVGEDGVEVVPAQPGGAAEALTLMRLALAARAVGCMQEMGRLAVQHANDRHAFGKPIGSFQAVSHRAAEGATVTRASELLLSEAAQSWEQGNDDWTVAAELATTFVAEHAMQVHLDAAHTLAATGFFEEHEAPWLFRRLSADLARLGRLDPRGQGLAELLVDQGRHLPQPMLGKRAEAFRAEVRSLLAQCGAGADAPDSVGEKVQDQAIARGWATLAWPVEHGGLGASIEEEIVLSEEFKYARVSFPGKVAADLLGPTVIEFGTPEQRARFLPLLASGQFKFFLGYSEPEVGSDLANLRARAVRDGDDWLVDAQKSWGTNAIGADWVWLAVRTDPDASRPHAGITVFLTRTGREGFSLQNHTALSGDVNCTSFFDSYRVPDSDRIGEVNGGWQAITHALAKERVMMATASADVLRLLDDLLGVVRADVVSTVGAVGSAHRRTLAAHAARLQAARLLAYAAARAVEAGVSGGAEASMAKIISSPLQEDFCVAAVQMLGPEVLLTAGEADAVADGAFDYHLRNAIKQVVGGGTIDVQRNLVARSVGLPR